MAIARDVVQPSIVLGADTIVLIGREVAGKPVDVRDAERMLRTLSGSWHEVLTGVAMVAGEVVLAEVARTRVRFAEMSAREIAWYIGTGEPFDKAGAYAIQGLASRFVEEIEGSYSNVVGLPIQTVYRLARELGVELIPQD
jgi:septum formation protein